MALLLLLLISEHLWSQVPLRPDSMILVTHSSSLRGPSLAKENTTIDLCSNGVDDDHNGLIDEKDFSCYYDQGAWDGCRVSKIIWTCSNIGLQWADPETGQEKLIGNFDGRQIYDIAWAGNGKLYAVANYSNEILEVDPYTSSVTTVGIMPGYYGANGLTADQEGNLYAAVVSGNSNWEIVKFNLIASTTTPIVNLGAAGLASGGDVTFLNGYLYLTATESRMVKINVATRTLDVRTIENTPNTAPMGLITMGDGYLYISTITDIYRIDPVTMKADANPYYHFQWPDIYMLGLANYTEHCNSPGCKSSVTAEILSPAPYCTDRGVWLHATGKGITGDAGYTWTLPGGARVSNDSLQVFSSGRYAVRYHTVPDTCGSETIIDVEVKTLPQPYLGSDTLFCSGGSLELLPKSTTGIMQYRWNDGSIQPSLIVASEGQYWLEALNECGVARDTIMVYQKAAPDFSLGLDTAICPGGKMVLNPLTVSNNWDAYSWNTGAITPTLTVANGGVFWLKVRNACGTLTDTVVVHVKDSCRCFPFYPKVELGADTDICSFESVTLKNLVHEQDFRYEWNDGSNSERLVVSKPGLYTLRAMTYCGSLMDTVVIALKTQGCAQVIYVPTAFSPNDDGKNDQLLPGVYGIPNFYAFYLYNRWGQLLFSSRTTTTGWDGRFAGRLQDAGVFIWRLEYEFPGSERKEMKGTVMLIR